MKKVVGIAALLLASTAALPAQAAKISFILDGTFTGTLDDVAFGPTGGVFTGIADTDDLGNAAFVPLKSFYAVIGGVTYNSSSAASIQTDNMSLIGFAGLDTFTIVFTLPDMIAVGGRPVTYYPTSNLWDTDRGNISITGGTDMTFGVAFAPVPEPAAWGMMLLGFGLVGASLRHRRTMAPAGA